MRGYLMMQHLRVGLKSKPHSFLKKSSFSDLASCFNLDSALEASDRLGCSCVAKRVTGLRDLV